MRAVLFLLAGCAGLAACTSSGPNQQAAAIPSISYPVTGNNVSQTGVRARSYCQQFGRSAQFQGVQATPDGKVAVYICGGVANTGAALAPPAMSGSTVAPAPPLTTATPVPTPFTPGAPTPLSPIVR